MAGKESLQELLQLTSQKHTLAGDFLSLTRKLAEILTSSDQGNEKDLNQLQDLLDRRQCCIDRINSIDPKISFLKQNITSESETVTEVEKRITGIFKEAQKIDRQNNAKLQNLMAHLSKRMKSLQAGKISSSAYTRLPRQVQGFFVDKRK